MSDVYQCTKCELRFISKSELEMHRKLDHPGNEPEPPLVYDDEERIAEDRRGPEVPPQE